MAALGFLRLKYCDIVQRSFGERQVLLEADLCYCTHQENRTTVERVARIRRAAGWVLSWLFQPVTIQQAMAAANHAQIMAMSSGECEDGCATASARLGIVAASRVLGADSRHSSSIFWPCERRSRDML